MDFYIASNGSCFMVTWTIFRNHLLKACLTQNQETMALRMLTTISLLYFWNSIWLRARSHMTSYYTWGYVTTLHDFGGVLGWPLDTFFWALTISRSRLLGSCVCEVALNNVMSSSPIHTILVYFPITTESNTNLTRLRERERWQCSGIRSSFASHIFFPYSVMGAVGLVLGALFPIVVSYKL